MSLSDTFKKRGPESRYVRKSLNLRDRRDEAARVWAAGALS